MYVVAGPNGAGKSTLTRGARSEFGVEVIDADAIQRETGSSNAEAWSEGLGRCRAAITARRSVLIETTLAGSDASRPSTYLDVMRSAKSLGYRVELTFIALENADAHVARVADRVAAGLHGIPEARIRDRYDRAIERGADALRFVDHALLLDNSSATEPFRLVAEVQAGVVVATASALPRWAGRMLLRFSLGIRTGEPDP
ncbi:MAG TPA: zeta toxin family protein [Candidatus Elarobacter sp.]|jgi:predicted ABC-type ATPase|nr:zeta toxin family protein [Candidatus Elarobacter sp.]